MSQPACKKRILIVEDDQTIRDVLSEFLRAEGYDVHTAKHGKEGIEILRKISSPCIILLDLFMPVMDGIGFLEALRQERGSDIIAALPVVVVSAAPPNGEVAQKIKSQISGFMKKPVDLEVILQVIQKHCA